MLVLTKKIIGAHPSSFFSVMVLGRRSIGKTSYSLKALHDFYVHCGSTDNNAWRFALGSLKFSIPQVIEYIETALNEDVKRPCLIWDDCRVHGSGSQYHLHMQLVSQLGGLLDVVRTSLSSLILTCPSSSGLLGILKSYDDYVVKIHHSPVGGYNRVGKGYLWSSLPSGKRLIYHKFDDSYSCRLPNWVHSQYMAARKTAMKDLLDDIKKNKS